MFKNMRLKAIMQPAGIRFDNNGSNLRGFYVLFTYIVANHAATLGTSIGTLFAIMLGLTGIEFYARYIGGKVADSSICCYCFLATSACVGYLFRFTFDFWVLGAGVQSSVGMVIFGCGTTAANEV